MEGFQTDDESAKRFKVLPPAESSKTEAINYGDDKAGVFSLVVFRAADKEDDAFVRNDEKSNLDVKAVSRGSLVTRGVQPPRISRRSRTNCGPPRTPPRRRRNQGHRRAGRRTTTSKTSTSISRRSRSRNGPSSCGTYQPPN